MRILWLTVDRSYRVAQQFDIFRSHVKQLADVVEIVKNPAGDKGQNMWQLSRKLISGDIDSKNLVSNYLDLDSNFDFIFCDAFFAYFNEDWQSFNIPSAILIEDVHQEVPRIQVARAKELGIETIFHRFNFAFHKFHPNARKDFNTFWLPHSIDTSKFKDYKGKNLKVLHVGVSPKKYYPYRANVIEQLTHKEYFTKIDRPKETGDRINKWPIDSDYAKLLSRTKICITGGSIFDAPVQKYVEIPASRTLLMSNWFPDLGLLGFVPDGNMLSYNKENLVEKVESILKDQYRLNNITTKGYELVTTNHNSYVRSKQFINNICDIVKIPWEFPSIKPCSYQVNFNYKKEPKKTIKKFNRLIKTTGADWRSRINV